MILSFYFTSFLTTLTRRIFRPLLNSRRLPLRKIISRILVAACMSSALLMPGMAAAGLTAEGYVTYDPSVEGMRDLRELLPIEGCNAPGGLFRVTDSDEPGSASFWCGQPPHCLSEGAAVAQRCKYVPYCRREPRGDPKGLPGANGCRDPQDLRCVGSGAMPVGGVCR